MNYLLKSAIQNSIALLPERISLPLYYNIQRLYGSFEKASPMPDLEKLSFMLRHIGDFKGRTFMELGTGRALNMPIGLWLCGAGKIITLDANPYLKEELVLRSVEYIKGHEADVRAVLAGFVEERRLSALRDYTGDFRCLMSMLCCDYRAPSDARDTGLPPGTVDFYFSNNVLEHIPREDIVLIHKECKRLLKPDGRIFHKVDLTDHFSHSDHSLHAMHFLRFSRAAWSLLAGNRYMYQNRLRAKDYMELFESLGLTTDWKEEVSDARAKMELARGARIHGDFVKYSIDELAVAVLNVSLRM